MLKTIKNYYLYILFLPLVANAIFNIYKTGFINNLKKKINLFDFFSTLLLLLFLLQVGIYIKESLNPLPSLFQLQFIFLAFIFDIILLFF